MSTKTLTNQSYMKDLYPEISDIEKAVFTNAGRGEDRKVNGQPYQDPDQLCRRLYEDEMRLFFEANHAQAELVTESCDYGAGEVLQHVIKHSVSGQQEAIKLTSDYIGPSATSAYHAGLENEFVWETILKCRTAGGHIVWPQVQGGINPAKAKSGNVYSGISDRADIVLYELRNYLMGDQNAERYNTALWKAFEKPVNKTWFHSFGDMGEEVFEVFCDFFRLKGSFVDDNYKIIWLAPKSMGKATKEDVKSFFKENTDAIARRNEILFKA